MEESVLRLSKLSDFYQGNDYSNKLLALFEWKWKRWKQANLLIKITRSRLLEVYVYAFPTCVQHANDKPIVSLHVFPGAHA